MTVGEDHAVSEPPLQHQPVKQASDCFEKFWNCLEVYETLFPNNKALELHNLFLSNPVFRFLFVCLFVSISCHGLDLVLTIVINA